MSERLVPLEFVHRRLQMDVAFAEVRFWRSLVAVDEDIGGVGDIGDGVDCGGLYFI